MSLIKSFKSKDFPPMIEIGGIKINPNNICAIYHSTPEEGEEGNVFKITMLNGEYFYWNLNSPEGQELVKYFVK